MTENQANKDDLVSYDIELSEDTLVKFETIKEYMKEVVDGDYLSCFFRAIIDEQMIKDSEPFYCFYENTEKLCKILQYIPQIEIIGSIDEEQQCIKPKLRILSTKKEINDLYDAIFIESDYLNSKKICSLNGKHLYDEIKIFIFLKIVTNIEVYLEDRLRKTLEHNKKLLDDFIKNLGSDMPTKWRNGEKIVPYDYYSRMNEIIFKNVLLFPYHEISGKTNHIYRKAFNLDLMNYPKKEQLVKMIKNRHVIIHRGSEKLLFEENDFSFSELDDYIKLSYEFVCWVEDNLAEHDLRKAYIDHYSLLNSSDQIPNDNLE